MSGWRFKRLPPFWKGVLGLILAGALVFGALLGQVLGGARDDVSGDPKTMVVLGCQLSPPSSTSIPDSSRRRAV